MQDVLSGDLEEDADEGLRSHMSRCEGCAQAWEAAWQVRAMLAQEQEQDPGEAYFEQATVSIMDRVSAIAASEAQPVPADEEPVVASARYGPLQIRGVGVAFIVALSFFVESVGASVDPVPTLPLRDAGGARLIPAPATPDLPVAAHADGVHAAYADHLHRQAALAGKQAASPDIPLTQLSPEMPPTVQLFASPPPLPQAA